MKFTRYICLFATGLTTLFASAQETWVDFNETTFPDPNFRARLIAFEQTQAVHGYQRPIIQGDRIRVDLMTSFTTGSSNISDLTGIQYFFNLQSLSTYNDASTLKHIDVSGLSKLTTLQIATGGHNSTSYTQSKNKGNVLETLIVDGTQLTGIYAHRLPKLKHLSAKDCPNLTSIYAEECDLMGLDLTGSTKITTVVVDNNPNLTYLRFDPAATGLYSISAHHTNLHDLNLPSTCTSSGSPYINLSYTKVSTLDLSRHSGKTGVSVYLTGCPLKSVWVAGLGTGGVGYFPTTSTVNAGCVNEFKVHEPGQLKSVESVSPTSGCTYNEETGMIRFNDGVTTAKYSFTTKKHNTSYTCAVTATRETRPLTLHIETTPSVNDLFANTSAEHKTETYELVNIEGTNIYETTLPLFYGNFQIVQTKEDGSRVQLGANSAQMTYKHKDLKQGYAMVQPENNYGLHMEQTKAPANNADKVARSAQPHFFYTTHPDELNGNELGLYGSKLSVEYVNGSPAGTFAVTGGVHTGIEDIIVNQPGVGKDDIDAPVEYYDLQGRRVANPVAGSLYIRRQGNTVTKFIAR